MKRRNFLAGAAVGGALAGAGALAAPAVAQSVRRLTMVTCWPRNAPGVGVNAERMAQRIEALSNGTLAIKLYAAGELVPPFGVLDAVASGSADIAHSTPYYWVGKAPALNYFTTIPYGLTPPELSGWIRYGGGQALWDEVYDELGVKAFYCGNSGLQAGGWFNKEINAVSDLQGLKMRIAGLGGQAMARLGAAPVIMPPPEIFTSLKTGVVDAAEWIGPWNDLAMGLHKAAKYYYMPAFHEPGPGLELMINAALWSEMDEHLRAVMQAAALASAEETLADFAYHNIQAMPELDTQGVQVRAFPEPVVLALGEATRAVVEELGASDAMTGKVHAAYMAFLRAAAGYGARMEAVMYTDRGKVWA